MSRIITNNLRHNDATADNLTLDGTGNITAPGNLTTSGNLSVTGTTTLTNDLNVDSGTLFVDASTNNVGFGTTNPERALHVSGNLVRFDNPGGAPGILLLDRTSGSEEGFRMVVNVDSTGSLSIEDMGTAVSGGGTERLRITNNGTIQLRNSPGIDFSQIQTNATGVISETLDSFEHGSWEARLRFGNTTEIGTYSTNSNAEYVKIGNIVHVSGFTRYDSVNTSNTGLLTMDLPFAVDQHGQPHNWVYPGSAVLSHSDLMTKGFFALCGNAGASRSLFGFYNSTSGNVVYVENSHISGWNGNTRYLHFNFTYQTND